MYETQGLTGRTILGAILGSLPGILLWIILGSFGITWALVGTVIAIGILFGFEKFGGTLDKAGIIICIVTLLVAIFIGEYMSWAMVFYSELKENDFTLTDCTFHLMSLLDLAEAKGSFFWSVAKGYLFGIGGAFGILKKLR